MGKNKIIFKRVSARCKTAKIKKYKHEHYALAYIDIYIWLLRTD